VILRVAVLNGWFLTTCFIFDHITSHHITTSAAAGAREERSLPRALSVLRDGDEDAGTGGPAGKLIFWSSHCNIAKLDDIDFRSILRCAVAGRLVHRPSHSLLRLLLLSLLTHDLFAPSFEALNHSLTMSLTHRLSAKRRCARAQKSPRRRRQRRRP
jgi:hypothetical protein